MKRRHFLAAELYSYSFDNYWSHLEVGNQRFTEYMPVEEGLASAEDIERLVVQICYRATDMSLLLDLEGARLSDYSVALRAEPELQENSQEDEEGPDWIGAVARQSHRVAQQLARRGRRDVQSDA